LSEKTLGWANFPENLAHEVNLNYITGEGSEIGACVVGADFDALVLSLDLASVDVLKGNLLADEVARPDSNAIVVNGDELLVCVVEEFNLVGNAVTDLVSADCLASLNLFKLQLWNRYKNN
jgi:hypothetical protein